MSEERLITALDQLTDKIDEMSALLGRGTKKTSQVPGGKSGTPEEKNAAKSFDAMAVLAKAGLTTQKELNKANKDQTDTVKDLSKSQKNATEEQRKLERSMERAKEGFTGFGKSLFKEKTDVAEALGSLGSTLSHSTGIVGRIFGGMASGVGLALGLMQNFADSARELGSFADLGAFQLGSVRQAKVLSGLGDSFIKVIEQSNGKFKALGGTSQQAIENLSNLSRSFRYGSSSLTSSMKKSLGTDLVKTVDKTADAIAGMGLSQEEQANLEASVLSTAMMTAKNEDDAKKKFVAGMLATSTSARGLSDTFGMSAKKIILAMAEFRGSQAGQFAALEGNQGAADIYAVLKEKFPSIASDPAKMANIAAAYAEGNMAKVYSNLEQGNDGQLATQLFDMFQGTIGKDGKLDTTKLNEKVEQKRSTMETMYASRKDLQGYGGDADKYAQGAIEFKSFFKERDIAQSVKPGDEAAKPTIKTTELENIKSMNSLTAALESLRGTLIGVSAAILGLTGAIGGLVLAGGLGALMGGKGGDMLGKIGSAVGGMFGGKGGGPAAGSLAGWKTGATAMTQGTGGIAGKAGGLMSSVGEKAGGMFNKLGGAASSGMSSFGDFLGKLGDSKTIKGAGTLALLGGALALAAHGFKTFGEVTWEGMLKGTIALGGLIGIAKLLDKGSNSILKGAGVIAILGASLAVSAVGFKVFNEVNWGSLVKGTLAIGGLVAMAKLLDKGSTSILKGAAVIGLLGATMWVAGKGFKTFNEVDWGSLIKGAVAIGVLGVAASLLGKMSASILIGSLAIGALGAAMWIAGKGFQTFNKVNWGSLIKGAVALGILGAAVFALGAIIMSGAGAVLFGAGLIGMAALGVTAAGLGLALGVASVGMKPFAEALKTIGDISGTNLILVGAGLGAIALGMTAFAAAAVVAAGGGIISGLLGLVGSKSPLERIIQMAPMADQIEKLGNGIRNFGLGLIDINSGLSGFDKDALGNLKDKLLEFAAAGSSDEVKLTAEYLASIGTSLGTIANIGDIKLPSMASMGSIPSVSTDIGSSLSPGESVVNDKAGSSLSPEAIAQLMSYLSSMQNDLAAIRSNTKSDGFSAPVRLS